MEGKLGPIFTRLNEIIRVSEKVLEIERKVAKCQQELEVEAQEGKRNNLQNGIKQFMEAKKSYQCEQEAKELQFGHAFELMGTIRNYLLTLEVRSGVG